MFAKCGVIILNFTRTQCLLYQAFSGNANSSSSSSSSSSPKSREITADGVVELYVISLLCVVGLFGNITSFVVLYTDKDHREAFFLQQMLAVTDCMYLMVAVLRYPVKHLVSASQDYVVMQPYVFPLLKTFQTITIWMIVLVTIDRFVYVCKPLQAQHILSRSTRRLAALAAFVGGFVFNGPRFFDSCVVKYVNPCNDKSVAIMTYTSTFSNTLYFDIYVYALYIVFLYLGPLTILCVMNIRLIQAIRRSRQRHRELTRTEGPARSENNATLVLVIIVVIFIICETPELIIRLLTAIDRRLKHVEIFSKHQIRFNTVSELLMVINSSINFFIYFSCGKHFRMNFVEMFARRFRPRADGANNELVPLQFRTSTRGSLPGLTKTTSLKLSHSCRMKC